MLSIAIAINARAALAAVIGAHDAVLSQFLINLPGPLFVELVIATIWATVLSVFIILLTDLFWKTRWLNRLSLRWLKSQSKEFWADLSQWRHFVHGLSENRFGQSVLRAAAQSWESFFGAVPAFLTRRVQPDRIRRYLDQEADFTTEETNESQRFWRACYSQTADAQRAAVNMTDPLQRQSAALSRLFDYVYCPEGECRQHDRVPLQELWQLAKRMEKNLQNSRRVRALLANKGDVVILPHPEDVERRLANALAWLSPRLLALRPVIELFMAQRIDGPVSDAQRNELRDAALRWVSGNLGSDEIELVIDRVMTEYAIAGDNPGQIEFARRLEAAGVNLSTDQHLEVAEAYISHASEVSADGSGELHDWSLEQARGHSYQASSKPHLEVIAGR
jgi:hypothetical protein